MFLQAAVVSDVLVLYVLKRRNYYRENKYLNVNDPSADYEIIDGKAAQEVCTLKKMMSVVIAIVFTRTKCFADAC